LGAFVCPKGAYFYRLLGQQGTTATASAEIQKINLRDGSEQPVCSFGGWPSIRTATAPDGQGIAVLGWLAHPDNRPRIWSLWVVDAASPSPALLEPHAENIKSIAFSPDGRTIAAGDSQGHVRLWDAIGHTELRSVDINSDELDSTRSKDISAMIYSPGGDGLLIGFESGAVDFVALSPAIRSRHFGDSNSRVGVVAYSHDGTLAMAGDDNGNISLWNAASGELLDVYAAGAGIVSVSFSADDRTILVSGRDGTVRVWPIELNDQSTLSVSPTPVGCLAVSPDDLLAAIGASNELDVVDIATGRRISHTALSGGVGFAGIFRRWRSSHSGQRRRSNMPA
jgi:WD40 repeat protein